MTKPEPARQLADLERDAVRYRIRFDAPVRCWMVHWPLWLGQMPFTSLPDAFEWIARHAALVAKDQESSNT